ncbi:MAG TPA: lipase maturation factor family protein [bacterium]|nr:lipase maturation factor family protein [bacterium]
MRVLNPSRARRYAIFFRFLALVFGIAFASIGDQIIGLVGRNGILPAAPLLERLGAHLGPERFHLLPTVFWLVASDRVLSAACWFGAVVSLAVAAGIAQRWGFILLWFLYLSITTVGRDFLSFQWDNLLLEAGLLAAVIAPGRIWQGRSSESTEPPPLADRLLEFLLFRLVFFSGVVKLASGDPTWRNLTALQYHFETQPLPTWSSWILHQSPTLLLRGLCAAALVLELVAPVLLLCGERARRGGVFGILALQLGFALTGNFGFFNLLSFALCIPLFGARGSPAVAPRRSAWPLWIFAALVFWIGGWQCLERVLGPSFVPAPAATTVHWAAPYRSINDYGLFAVMTLERPEFIFEASEDGNEWREIEFRWKPGQLDRRPRFTGPLMPRLDWQMWFAALEGAPPPWVMQFARRVLEGSPAVLDLLANSEARAPRPRFVRILLYDYQFTSFDERRATGHWWKRQLIRAATTPLSLPPAEAAPAAPSGDQSSS